jgi:hypothetical protein
VRGRVAGTHAAPSRSRVPRVRTVADGAADAAVAQQDDVVIVAAAQHVVARDELVVDALGAQLVLNHQDALAVALREDAPDERRLARAQPPRENRHGQPAVGGDRSSGDGRRRPTRQPLLERLPPLLPPHGEPEREPHREARDGADEQGRVGADADGGYAECQAAEANAEREDAGGVHNAELAARSQQRLRQEAEERTRQRGFWFGEGSLLSRLESVARKPQQRNRERTQKKDVPADVCQRHVGHM